VKVLVLGGYGNFGARISRALARDASIQLVVCGRDGQRASELASSIDAAALRLDVTAADLAVRFTEQRADLVIHTAGPFQGQDFHVARAAAAAGAHYIDLADGRRFVCDFEAGLDAAFMRTGRTAITGASSVPALSSSVVAAALPRFGRLDAIETCIAPGQRAPRGEATLAGVLSYCGTPIRVWKGGTWQQEAGWAQPVPVRFAKLRPRLAALCDIPDLELFPRVFAPVQDVSFRAALEVRFTQWVFAGIARARALGLLRRPERLARVLHRTGGLADPFGSGEGGMFVRLRGVDPAGAPLSLAWHLTAPGGHGPEIPCMPAILLARRWASGQAPLPGARPCMGLLALADFDPEFRRWGMATQWDVDGHGAPAA
jgi:saccharopine dehydrogenase-like NADP-dependent oxidoreductase